MVTSAHLATSGLRVDRIAGKRLRYGLEPFVGAVGGLSPLIRKLTRLQDAIGRWHDASVVLAEVTAEANAPGTTRSARSAILVLARRLRRDQATGFAVIEREWRDDHATGFFAAQERIARQLATRGQPEQEIERKYLLRDLPPRAVHAAAATIDQGYMPGKRLVERAHPSREDEGRHRRYFRTVKLGSGLTRTDS